jgi:hypothetical protein
VTRAGGLRPRGRAAAGAGAPPPASPGARADDEAVIAKVVAALAHLPTARRPPVLQTALLRLTIGPVNARAARGRATRPALPERRPRDRR